MRLSSEATARQHHSRSTGRFSTSKIYVRSDGCGTDGLHVRRHLVKGLHRRLIELRQRAGGVLGVLVTVEQNRRRRIVALLAATTSLKLGGYDGLFTRLLLDMTVSNSG